MSYSAAVPDYQYTSGSNYDSSYSQQYDSSQYSSSSVPSGQYTQPLPTATGQYNYSYSSEQYNQPAAPSTTDYSQSTGYSNITGYTGTSSSYSQYPYAQDTTRTDPLTSSVSKQYESPPAAYQVPSNQYSNGITARDTTPAPQATDYSQYQYPQTEYTQPAQDTSSYSSSYDPVSSTAYSYQESPSYTSGTWSTGDQYTDSAYQGNYYQTSTSNAASYDQKDRSTVLTTSYNQPSSVGYSNDVSVSYSQTEGSYPQADVSYSHTDGGYSQSDRYGVSLSNRNVDMPYERQEKPNVAPVPQDYSSFSRPAQFSEDRNSSKSFTGGSFNIPPSNTNYSNQRGRSSGRGDFRSYRGSGNQYNNRGSNNSQSRGHQNTFVGRSAATPRNNIDRSGSSFGGARGFSNAGNRDGWQAGRGSSSFNRGNRHSSFNKSQGGGFDARSRINESKSASTAPSKAGNNPLGSAKAKTQISPYKAAPVTKKVEEFKAPSRPQDRLLNEIEEREKAKKEEETKKTAEEIKKAEEEAKKAEEEERKRMEEELLKKLADEAVKAAPPSKPPETPEEIAKEEEIQRKIRESVVIVNPEQEIALMMQKEDPSRDVEMSEELRDLLKKLTTDYFCKLCSVRIVGPHMAAMHYNGKNHLKKLRNFVQTNGRSAGFNMEPVEKMEVSTEEKKKGEEKEAKAEIVEITEIDEKKYCKICKVSFSQDSQAEMHYKGKNHTKKKKNLGNENGPEVFECKICCVTVTAQEHLTAHLNGARHKLQIRKLDTNENYRGGLRGRGGLGFRGRGGRGGRGGGDTDSGEWRSPSEPGFRGRGYRGRGGGDSRGRGHDQGSKRLFKDYTDEELLTLFDIDPAKKYKFDLANFRTPSGGLYCSSCDVSMLEEPYFLLHLGSKKHRDEVLGKKKKNKKTGSHASLTLNFHSVRSH